MMPRLPYRLQRRGGDLLNQQCWLWGQDVRRAEGNLLLELGFQRTPAPANQQGCTQYTRLRAGVELRLWGFGVYHRAHTGVYLNRYSFAPLCAVLDGDVWTASAFERLPSLPDGLSLPASLRSLAALEQETQQLTGLPYRRRCMYGWSKRALPPEDLAPAWLSLASDIEESCILHAHQRRRCQRKSTPAAPGETAGVPASF